MMIHSDEGGASLVEVLRWRADRQGPSAALTYLRDDGTAEPTLTYGELDARARASAVMLRERVAPGDRVLLVFPPGLDFLVAFLGCLYARAVAVPLPAQLGRGLKRLVSTLLDARPALGMTTPELRGSVCGSRSVRASAAADLAQLSAIPWVDLGAADPAAAERWQPDPIDPGALAYLQYTSGSTSTPKGVMVSHANLIHNLRCIREVFGNGEDTVYGTWLPFFHDMGLIDGHLQPLFSGIPGYVMSSVSFIRSPIRWLRMISQLGVTCSGGPNFAYELCARRITPDQRQGLDLSRWRVAYNGAEPIRRATLERFVEAFGPCGFRREAFFPCYGMAEATLMITGGPRGKAPVYFPVEAAALQQHRAVEPAGPGRVVELVGCGELFPGIKVRIVDPHTLAPCAEGEIGEVWTSSPSVTLGYWRRPEDLGPVFQARVRGEEVGRRYLRTGDLGFLRGQQLVITGRIKDVIIIRGRNHYPQDIETTVAESHPALRSGACAAFSVDDGEERLVVVSEVERRSRERSGGLDPSDALPPGPPFDRKEVLAAVRRAVVEVHDLQVHALVLIRPGTLPKTSSGKVARSACRAAFLSQTLAEIA